MPSKGSDPFLCKAVLFSTKLGSGSTQVCPAEVFPISLCLSEHLKAILNPASNQYGTQKPADCSQG